MAVNARRLTPVLCVDLDGTLIRSDLLLESLLLLLKRNPLYLFATFMWLLRGGKAGLKSEIAARVTLNPAALPYNTELLTWIQSERATGREVWLCTAANERLATRVAQHVQLFDGVIASDTRNNLAGQNKADQLIERFGKAGFDYCGNERRDMAIWRCAHSAIVVNASAAVEREARAAVTVDRVFPGAGHPAAGVPGAGTPTAGRPSTLRAVVRALRPHQWAKNILVLVPLFTAHRFTELHALCCALAALVAFCLCASSVYLLNDMLDLEADRGHPRKSKRPFASGDLSIATGLVLAPLLLGAAALIAVFLPGKFQLCLAAYYVLTFSYSIKLKRMLLVDAVALAGLYTLRIIAGAGATTVALSFWLLLFSVFLFLSLAFVKRYAELDSLRRQQKLQALGRGYRVEDLAVLQSFGTAAGYLSVLVLALYINSPEIQPLYHRPKAIWMLCVLMLYWISRVWMTAHRGGMHDDPVVYALRDRVSLGIGVLAAITVAVAI
jgi:4-hydroxybenzoate polyprenyltransferase/phosphoserine phosphatase